MEKFFENSLILILIYILVGIIFYSIFKKIFSKIIAFKTSKLDPTTNNYKKLETIKQLTENIVKYLLGIIVILLSINTFGINVGSILAGIGIIGLVIGLALQDIFKDFIAGVSIIIENQYTIGDNVQIGDFRGEVIFLGLKTTKIKSYHGAVKVFANRNITEVINYSLEKSLAVVNIPVSYEENIDKLEKHLQKIKEYFDENLEFLEEEIELVGITSFDNYSMNYRMTAITKSMEHFKTERTMRKYIKTYLEKQGITIPYPKVEIDYGRKNI